MSKARPNAARSRPPYAWIAALVVVVALGFYLLSTGQPSPAQPLVERGRQLAQSGQMAEAAAQWKQAVALNSQYAAAWEELGSYYRSAGDYDSAVEAYRRLASLNPDMPGVFGNLASSVARAPHARAAYEAALKQIAAKPDDVAALTIAASYLTDQDEDRMRLTFLRRLSQLRPKDPDFLTTLTESLVNTHHYEEARPLLDRLVTLAPNSPAGYDLRGQVLLNGVGTPQALAQAESDFLKALQLNSPSRFPHLYLGQVYLRMNQPDKALEQLHTAAEQLPYDPDLYYELARAFTMAKQPERAAMAQARFLQLRQQADRINVLTKRVPAFPNDFALRLELARLLMKTGELGKARTQLSHALALRPDDAEAKEAARQFLALSSSAGGQH